MFNTATLKARLLPHLPAPAPVGTTVLTYNTLKFIPPPLANPDDMTNQSINQSINVMF